MNKSITFFRIQCLCELHNITVYTLEKALSINHGTIQKWKTVVPSTIKLICVADHFGVSVDYLLGRCSNPVSHLVPEINSINWGSDNSKNLVSNNVFETAKQTVKQLEEISGNLSRAIGAAETQEKLTPNNSNYSLNKE